MPPLLSLVAAFLLGSLPFAFWAGHVAAGIDIRKEGSGNPGASNVFRVLGPVWGVGVFLLDAAKGWAAVWLAQFLGGGEVLSLAAGLLAVLGHSFSPFIGFRGGKGVATSAGFLLRLAPLPLLSALGLFALVFLATGMVSAGSLVGAAAFPVLVAWLHTDRPWLMGVAIALAVLIWLRHHGNIRRILKGEETPVRFWRRKSGD